MGVAKTLCCAVSHKYRFSKQYNTNRIFNLVHLWLAYKNILVLRNGKNILNIWIIY